MKRLLTILMLAAGLAGALTIQYPAMAFDSIMLGDTNWTNKDSFGATRHYVDEVVAAAIPWDSIYMQTGWGILLTWSGDTGTIAVKRTDTDTAYLAIGGKAADAALLQGRDTTDFDDAKTLQTKDTSALRLLCNNQPVHATAWGDSVSAIEGDKAAAQVVSTTFRVQDTLDPVANPEGGGNVYLFTFPVADSLDILWCKILMESLSVTGVDNGDSIRFSMGDSNATGNGTLSDGEITWIAAQATSVVSAYTFTTAAMQGTNLRNPATGALLGWFAIATANKVYFNWGGTPVSDGRLGIKARVWFGCRSTKIGTW